MPSSSSEGTAQAALLFEPPPERAPSRAERAFRAWMAGPGLLLYYEVMERAFMLKRAGFGHYGIKALLEAIRFDRAVRLGPDGSPYKVNNNYGSRLAREIMQTVPELAGFFETRELRER